MDLGEISKKIKELEKKAKESDYWKDRYMAQGKAIEKAIEELQTLLGVAKSTRKKTNPKTLELNLNRLLTIVYEKMKIEDYNVGTKELEREFEASGLDKTNSYHLHRFRVLLQKQPGIDFRRKGRNKIFYYSKHKDTTLDNGKTRIIAGKISLKT